MNFIIKIQNVIYSIQNLKSNDRFFICYCIIKNKEFIQNIKYSRG